MSKALSVDLRDRVVAAVEGGMSCRQAAARFGISASSAIRWRSRVRTQGDVRPGPLGGDRRAAEHWWREAIRIGPSIPMGYEALGRSRLQAGDATGALALFRSSQRKGPRWADPIN